MSNERIEVDLPPFSGGGYIISTSDSLGYEPKQWPMAEQVPLDEQPQPPEQPSSEQGEQ